jgi:hypothetical protein
LQMRDGILVVDIGGASMPEATPRPWKAVREGESLWIEGPRVSAATEHSPGGRRVVCDLKLYGDADLDAETEANARLIVARVNAGA